MIDDEYSVHSTVWVLVLADWKNAGARVRIFLRSGQTVGPGRVIRLPSSGFPVTLEGSVDQRTAKWDVDPTEIVAVEAVASR